MQQIISNKVIVSLLTAILILSVTACASLRGSNRVEVEKLLTAAGFRKGIADTPDRLAAIKKLPQRKVVPQEDGDKLVYIYADAKDCECAYAGNEEAYQKYLKLTHAKQIADDDRREAVRNKQRQMDSDDASWGRDW